MPRTANIGKTNLSGTKFKVPVYTFKRFKETRKDNNYLALFIARDKWDY